MSKFSGRLDDKLTPVCVCVCVWSDAEQ